MKQFLKNTLRMAGQNRGSLIGAVLIMAIGIFVYVSMTDTLRNLSRQVEYYYEISALSDVFAEVSGISGTELSRLKEIPGIAEVSGKMSADLRLLCDGQEELVTVHLLSYDPDDPLNRLSLSGGTAEGERLYLGVKMADTYRYTEGTELRILSGGRSRRFVYAGSCYAPNYIYTIPPGGAMMPDGEVYDIACISEDQMEELLGQADHYTELAFSLKEGYSFQDVKQRLSDELSANGLLSLTERAKQTSYEMVDSEIHELIAMGSVVPVLFLGISVFMLYIVLRKMIDRDESLIGTMKAFGMSDRELIAGYLFEGGAIGLLGALFGGVLAGFLGRYMFAMYVAFFNLPDTVYRDYAGSRIIGILLSVGTGVFAAYLGVRGILAITPAQAMRAGTPKAVRSLRLPHVRQFRLSALKRAGISFALRKPLRGLVLMLSVAFPFAMVSVLASFEGVADQMFYSQFSRIQTYDLQASLDGYTSPGALLDASETLSDVTEREAVLTLTARLSKDNRTEFAMLYGLHPDSGLWRVMDNKNRYYRPPEKGLILNSRTAEKLHVEKGDQVFMDCPGFTVEPVRLPVTEVIEESFGGGAYISMESLPDTIGISPMANTLLLKTREGRRQSVKDELMRTSRVAWLSDAVKTLESYRSMMRSMIAMIDLFAVLAAAAGAILIYNVSMINIRERVMELGTLKILGAGDRETGELLLLEQLLYFIAGIVVGFPGSRLVKWLIESIIMAESYTVRMEIPLSSYLLSFVACLLMSGISLYAQMRFVRGMDLADCLKGRE